MTAERPLGFGCYGNQPAPLSGDIWQCAPQDPYNYFAILLLSPAKTSNYFGNNPWNVITISAPINYRGKRREIDIATFGGQHGWEFVCGLSVGPKDDIE